MSKSLNRFNKFLRCLIVILIQTLKVLWSRSIHLEKLTFWQGTWNLFHNHRVSHVEQNRYFETSSITRMRLAAVSDLRKRSQSGRICVDCALLELRSLHNSDRNSSPEIHTNPQFSLVLIYSTVGFLHVPHAYLGSGGSGRSGSHRFDVHLPARQAARSVAVSVLHGSTCRVGFSVAATTSAQILTFSNFLFFFNRWFHLGFNLVVQLLVGLPLEMVHGSTRIGCVYLAGVLAGSLGKFQITVHQIICWARRSEFLRAIGT